MSKCYACGKALNGTWNMTSCSGYEMTGRYLGISDGYYLHSGNPNWVYCYCYDCWQKQILSLSFVNPKLEQLMSENQSLKTELQSLNVQKQQLIELTLKVEEKELKLKSFEVPIQIGKPLELASMETDKIFQLLEQSLQKIRLVKNYSDQIKFDQSIFKFEQKEFKNYHFQLDKIFQEAIQYLTDFIRNQVLWLISDGQKRVEELDQLVTNINQLYNNLQYKLSNEEQNQSVNHLDAKKKTIQDALTQWQKIQQNFK